jgi:hypothetical protein
MKKLYIYYLLITASSSIFGMEKTLAWVRTHDGKLTLISNSDVIKSSNLLKKLSQQHEGSAMNPIELPTANQIHQITKEELQMFCVFHGTTGKTLYNTLAKNSYEQLIDVTAKLHAPNRFLDLEIAKLTP